MVFNHLSGATKYLDVSSPKGLPRHMPFLDTEDEKLRRPE